MDVLIGAAEGVLPRPPKSRSRVFRYAVGASVAAHGALMAVVLLLPRSAQPTEVPIEVNVVSEPPVEVVAPPPEPEPQPVVPVRERLVPAKAAASPPPRRLEPPEASTPPSPQPPPLEEPTAEAAPAAETPEPPAPATADDKGTTLVAMAPGGPSSPSGGAGYGRAGGGTAAGTGHGMGEGGVVNGTGRRILIDGYRNELLRTRIASHFRYPAEARELELTGQVIVAVTIRKDGQLLNVRLAGRCPHAILCTDGLRTIRASAPFPPIPAALGDSLQIEVPFNYNFE